MRNPNRGSPLNGSINVLVGVRVTLLPKCHLVLSLLKHRDVGAFLNLKMRNPNRGNPLNSSINILVGVRVTFLPKCLLVLSLLKHRGV